MPKKRKRKSFEQLDALSKGRNKRTEEADAEPQYSESTNFSFMKDEGGRPHKKKKKSIGRALAKRWDNKIPDYALNNLEAAHKRLIRMRGCRSKFGAGSMKFWFWLYLFISVLAFQIFDGLSRYQSLERVAKHQGVSCPRLSKQYDFYIKTGCVMVTSQIFLLMLYDPEVHKNIEIAFVDPCDYFMN